ncbi:hypothetical protein ACGFJT_44260 [Actinomadura geliboluensis]|uniref:hypothetical protein n=1 Tax=Actinomadura geliboluensis TaxID=882440 RepID=UPI00371E2662
MDSGKADVSASAVGDFTQGEPRATTADADLEARFDRWAAERRRRLAARSPEDNHKLVRRSVLVLLGLALIMLAAFTGLSNHAYERTASANAARIGDLNSEIASSPGISESVASEAIAALGTAAAEASERVAARQREFAGLSIAASKEAASGKGNGAPGKAMSALVNHRRSLAEYWDEKSLIVDDDLAYRFTTSPYFDDDEIDPRFPWYVRYDGVKASEPSTYAWAVESAMPVLDAPTTARVVWVCRDSKGVVLAWANAIYDGETKTFHDLDLDVTAEGAEHEQTAHADGRAPKPGEGGEGP